MTTTIQGLQLSINDLSVAEVYVNVALPPGLNTHVFISHAKADLLVARAIAYGLMRNGLRVWLAERDVKRNVLRDAQGGVHASCVFLCLVSREYREGLDRALSRDNICPEEFILALTTHAPARMLAVPIDDDSCNPRTWTGALRAAFNESYYYPACLAPSSVVDMGSWQRRVFGLALAIKEQCKLSMASDMFAPALLLASAAPYKHSPSFDSKSMQPRVALDDLKAAVATSRVDPLPPGSVYHAFLAHTWRTDRHGRDIHRLAVAVAHSLALRGLRVFFDEMNLWGSFIEGKLRAVEASCVFTPLICDSYLSTVMGADATDECRLEFEHALSKYSPDCIIGIPIESTWAGNMARLPGLVGSALAWQRVACRLDPASDGVHDAASWDAQLDRLAQEIRVRCTHLARAVARDPTHSASLI
eukprot:m.248331 g.248331  ORF g.248331 m.248331 type:complete len:418 (+) comp15701_c0_seq1:1-1254(+)